MSIWNYDGDISLEEGGFYWAEDGYDDYVLAVDVTPCSAAGGPDNLFHIAVGSIFLGSDPAIHQSALDTIGGVLGEASRSDLIYAMKAYRGLDGPDQYVVWIGKPEEVSCSGWNPEPDTVLRKGSSLRNYVKREWLR